MNVHHTQDVGGDGGSDVGTHDDTNCLFEFDDVCINKTDDDDGGGGRALYRCGDQCTKSTALKMLLLIFSSVRSKRPPEAFSRPVPNRCIP